MHKKISALFSALLIIITSIASADEPPLHSKIYENKGDYIVLLHGIARNNSNMDKIAKHFHGLGYHIINIDYPSQTRTLDKIVQEMDIYLTPLIKVTQNKIHFIGHSMGGIVIRAFLKKHRPEHMGRVVLLGTPNKGSQVADAFKDNAFYQSFYGPAGQDLTTDAVYLKKLSAEPLNYEMGVIAGDRSIDPVSSIILTGKDDGKVTIESTKLDGIKDHITLHTTHTFMMKNKKVIAQAEFFIKNGVFNHKVVFNKN